MFYNPAFFMYGLMVQSCEQWMSAMGHMALDQYSAAIKAQRKFMDQSGL